MCKLANIWILMPRYFHVFFILKKNWLNVNINTYMCTLCWKSLLFSLSGGFFLFFFFLFLQRWIKTNNKLFMLKTTMCIYTCICCILDFDNADVSQNRSHSKKKLCFCVQLSIYLSIDLVMHLSIYQLI